MTTRLGAEAAIAQLSGWSNAKNRDAIEKTYKFGTFADAFRFMTAVAAKAEEMDHHPEWFNVYNRVDVTLSTHDAEGVTAKDVELARFMDGLTAA